MPSKKIAVVSGATSGIGFVTALELAKAGMRVIGMGRDQARIAEKDAEIKRAVPRAQIEWVMADFASLSQVKRAADDIAARIERIDILVNNAGLHLDRRSVTEDGFEATFQVNHLASFVLTLRLLPLLKRSNRAHVIAVSSIGHTMIDDMCWDDLQMEKDFSPFKAYCQSKLANVLFTRELARRYEADGVIASAVHPGMVASRFPLTAGEHTVAYYRAAEASGEALTEEQGADTVVWLAQHPDAALPSGGYFTERKRVDTSAAGANSYSPARLWDISEQLARNYLQSISA